VIKNTADKSAGTKKEPVTKKTTTEKKEIRDRHQRAFSDELAEINYIKRNRAFYTLTMKQAKTIIDSIDRQLGTLTEKSDTVSRTAVVQGSSGASAGQTIVRPAVETTTHVGDTKRSADVPTRPAANVPTLEEFLALDARWQALPKADSQRQALGRQIVQMEKAMKEGNVSFVPKLGILSSAEDKIKYAGDALGYMDMNEASAMDALAAFERYGSRYESQEA